MKRVPSVDPASYGLAEYFLPKGTEEQLMQLAGVVQEAVEEWLQEHEAEDGTISL